MKKKILLALLLGAAIAPAAMANLISITATAGANNGLGGGEFTAVTVPAATLGLPGPLGVGFQTFCIETDETIHYSQTYNYSTAQVDHDGDVLTKGTAWLFAQFSAGTLSGYHYTLGADRTTDAANLQAALWHFQGEAIPAGYDGSSSNPYIMLASTTLGASATDASAGAYGVNILNINDVNGAPAQDLLALVPDGGTTIALLGFALVGVESLRRKFAR